MSTRSNTIIRDLSLGGEEEILYRHCDGYLSGAGLDQMKYLNKMLKQGTEITVQAVQAWYLKNGDGYETTDAIHEDIEYIYVLELNGNMKKFNLRAYRYDMFADDGRGKIGQELTDELMKLYDEEGLIFNNEANKMM